MDNRPIGIFDSGLGGLTAVKEILNILPGEDIVYFGDTGRIPYGTRSKETIIKYVKQDIAFLKSFDVKLIISACGTASSVALPYIKSSCDIPIIGVVECAAAESLRLSENKKIGILGTSGTIKSGAFENAIKKADKDAVVVPKACPMFVPLVENGYTEGSIAREIATEYLAPLIAADVDTIILGCTHYPLLKGVLSAIMKEGTNFVDSGAMVAKQAKEILAKGNLLSEKSNGTASYFVSDDIESFTKLGGIFLCREINGDVSKIQIEEY